MGLLDNIKQSANTNGTTIQSSDAQQLSKILDKTFYLDKNIKEECKFIKHVMTRGQESGERTGLHASEFIVGDSKFCLRKQVLSLLYKQLQGDQVDVGLRRIFAEGDSVHEKWQRLFIRAGYSDYSQLDVTQFNKQFRISFTPDILCTIPEFYDGEMVGELKSMNTFQFKKITKHPTAGKQLQWYMYLTGIYKGFVLTEDKNDQKFLVEVYDYDKHIVLPFIERAEEVKYYYKRAINEGRMVNRPKDAATPDCKRCKTCSMREACWGVGQGKVRLGE